MAADKERLITKNFIAIATANFFLFLSFYSLMPLLPFYLIDKFKADGSVIGLVLASYMVSCIIIRPFCGYILDTFKRRPVYLLAYFLFGAIFCGYMFASLLSLFVIFRIAHGFTFGMTTVSGSTIVSQIIPRSRLGEGLGYYGLANTLSMCLGPMLGLMAYYKGISFDTIFFSLFIVTLIGFVAAAIVKIPPRKSSIDRHINIESFFITKAVWVSLCQLLLFIPYGATSAYIAVYAEQLGISNSGGLYFTFMAIGLAISRPVTGRRLDKGDITHITAWGMAFATLTIFALSYLELLPENYRNAPFLFVGLLQGLSYGILQPSFNTLFVRLAPDHRRGAATSMFLTSNDLGIGIGMLIGSMVASYYGGFYAMYRLGAWLSILGLLLFIGKAKSHYLQYRVD